MKTAQLLLIMEGFRDACEDLEFYRWWESLAETDKLQYVNQYFPTESVYQVAEQFRSYYRQNR